MNRLTEGTEGTEKTNHDDTEFTESYGVKKDSPCVLRLLGVSVLNSVPSVTSAQNPPHAASRITPPG
jgi:hypothetical protein